VTAIDYPNIAGAKAPIALVLNTPLKQTVSLLRALLECGYYSREGLTYMRKYGIYFENSEQAT
jgi:hypothetical protein